MNARPPASLLAALLTTAACGSNHHVSEWGNLGHPDLSLYFDRPNVDTHLAEIDSDADLAGFARDHELAAKVGADEIIARSYVGPGKIGTEAHAIRVASPYGIILALGPNPPTGSRDEPSTMIVVLATGPDPGAATFRSMMDLTGDGTPDLIARATDGRLAVFSLRPRGAVRLQVSLEVPPREAADVDADGRVDLMGHVLVDADDPIQPNLVDAATFDGEKFSNRTEAARAFHARSRDSLDAMTEPTEPAPKLRRALERAWHAVLAGSDRDKTLDLLDESKPTGALASDFAMHRRRIEKISR